jgi:hypothetical protein
MSDGRLTKQISTLSVVVKNLVGTINELEARVEILENTRAEVTTPTPPPSRCVSLEGNELYKMVSQKKEPMLSGVSKRSTRVAPPRAERKTIDELLEERDRELLGDY